MMQEVGKELLGEGILELETVRKNGCVKRPRWEVEVGKRFKDIKK